jgi:hypothetical protein
MPRSSSPTNLIDINLKRFIRQWSFMPDPSTRPSPVILMLNQASSNRIQMGVLNPLPQHFFIP